MVWRSVVQTFLKFFRFIPLLLALSGCLGNRHSISQRPITGAQEVASSREVVPPPAPQDVYTKQTTLSIKPIKKINTNGSLTSLDDPRAYLLASTAPLVVGTFLDIKTVTNADAAKAPAAPAAKGSPAAQIEQDLLKSLPNLDPVQGDPDKPNLVTNFKAEVLEVLENGDAIVGYHRRSVRGDQASDYLVKARVPQAALAEKDSLTTANLVDVEFRESREGELSERHSSRWEDEYTLRMSGFDEARSKSAVALEDQRRQLKDTRDKLATQIKAFSTERNTVAKERADYVAKKKEEDQKITDLETKVKEQNEEIDKLKPKEEEKVAEEVKLTDDPKAKNAAKKPAPTPAPKAGTANAKPATPPTKVAQAKPAAPANGGAK
jgi:hypothetical protein